MGINQNIHHIYTMEERYQRAKTILQGCYSKSLIRNDAIFPQWIENTNSFWYERIKIVEEESSTKIGKEYRLVDIDKLTNETAFNHKDLSDALSRASGQRADREDLPISHITMTLFPFTISFNAFDQRWLFEEGSKQCKKINTEIKITETVSPDGKYIAFTRDHNVWLRDAAGEEEKALTLDGEEDYAYGGSATGSGNSRFPEVPGLWSPDSTKLLIVQRDKRRVKTLPIIDHVPQDGSIRPILRQPKVAHPGDENLETYRILTIDIVTGNVCSAQHPPILSNANDYCGFFNKVIWWSKDSKHVYFLNPERGDQVFEFVEFDCSSGTTRILFKETSNTQINYVNNCEDPIVRLLPDSNELIWWSERSDWGHLYLYDLKTGELKHPITSGNWRVRSILFVDRERREILIQTCGRVSGRDPYYRDICRVNIDTGEITTVYSCDQETIVHHPLSHSVTIAKLAGRASKLTSGVSPSGNNIILTRSRADQGSVCLLIDRDGDELLELEHTDLTSLPSDWIWPEPVNVIAADGITPLYGIIFKPLGFNPNNKYPVINIMNSGPLLSIVPKASFHSAKAYSDRSYFYAAALAALGFVVLILDSRGTGLRSKAFQDESYGWTPSAANTEDHAHAIEQLASRYPFMDINRVGIFCQLYQSGLQNFLERQDLYKVCVQMSLLDDRLNPSMYGDKYEGRNGPCSDKLYPEQLVNNLQGKLLLINAMYSGLAPVYPVAATFRVIHALQEANKDFDMLIIPHGGFVVNSYMYRRAFDYLIKHLMETDPPEEFLLDDINETHADVKKLKCKELADKNKAH